MENLTSVAHWTPKDKLVDGSYSRCSWYSKQDNLTCFGKHSGKLFPKKILFDTNNDPYLDRLHPTWAQIDVHIPIVE